MSENKVPITRLGKFFGAEDFNLDISMGEEWLHGDMNFTLVLYRIDRKKTVTDDVYGETVSDGIKFLPPIEFKAFVQVMAPENKNVGNSKIEQFEPGNIRVSVYQSHLDELGIDIEFGDLSVSLICFNSLCVNNLFFIRLIFLIAYSITWFWIK